MAKVKLANVRPLDLSGDPTGEPVDLAVEAGRLARSSEDLEVIDLEGCWVLPGLWDRHVHFTSWALDADRPDLLAAGTAQQALDMLAADLASRPGAGVLVATGMRPSVWPQPLDTAQLDRLSPHRPVVLLSADLHSAQLNTAALEIFGHADRAAGGAAQAGLLVEMDSFALQDRLNDELGPRVDALLLAAEEQLAALGVVGIVDVQRMWNHGAWPHRVDQGMDLLRVQAACWPETLDRAIAEGYASGRVLDPEGLITAGPLKIISDGSLGSGTAWCSQPYPVPVAGHPHGIANLSTTELVDLMSAAEQAGIDCAVHAIGDLANEAALDAFAETQARGSIEHAQLISADQLARMAGLGVLASVQPDHLIADREAIGRCWAGRESEAYPFASMLRAGVRLAFGSDAPVVAPNPWTAIRSAVLRAGPGEPAWQPQERITLSEALLASTGGVGALVPGGLADLIALPVNPFEIDPAELGEVRPVLTMTAGRITYLQ